MSEENLREAEAAQEQARIAAQKFEAIRQTQQAEHGELPKVPQGRPPESVPHRAVPVEKLEKAPKPKGEYRLRDFLRDRYAPKEGKPQAQKTRTVVKQQRVVVRERATPFRGSSSVNVRLKNGRVIESSGRLSTELNPAHASRLTHLREQIRAFQNRRELSSLEKVWRKTRAQRSHDPELRP